MPDSVPNGQHSCSSSCIGMCTNAVPFALQGLRPDGQPFKNIKSFQITVIWWVRNSNLTAVRSVELLLLYLLSLHHPVFFFSSSVFVCPVRANGSLDFVGLVALSFPRDLVSYPFLFLWSSGHPCLVPVSIFRADIFSFSRRHPCPVMLWFWLNLPERAWCWHRLCIHGRDTGHHCCYGCHSIFKAGFAYFSVANLTQAAHGKYHVVIPAEIWRQPSAFSS